jgi:hypothetical protein
MSCIESMGLFSLIFVILDVLAHISVARGVEDNIFVVDVWRKTGPKAGVIFVTISFFASFCNNNVFFPRWTYLDV